MHQEYLDVKQYSEHLSLSITAITEETQRLKLQSERTMDDLSDKISFLVADIKRSEKVRAARREEFALKRGQSDEVVNDLNDKLYLEEIGKRNAANTLKMLKDKLSERRFEMETLKNPREERKKHLKEKEQRRKGMIQRAPDDTKVFLASQRLATAIFAEQRKNRAKSSTPMRPKSNASPLKEA